MAKERKKTYTVLDLKLGLVPFTDQELELMRNAVSTVLARRTRMLLSERKAEQNGHTG